MSSPQEQWYRKASSEKVEFWLKPPRRNDDEAAAALKYGGETVDEWMFRLC